MDGKDLVRYELLRGYTYIQEENRRMKNMKDEVSRAEARCAEIMKEEEGVSEISMTGWVVLVALGVAFVWCVLNALLITEGGIRGWYYLAVTVILVGLIRVVYTVFAVKGRDGCEIEKARIHNEKWIPACQDYEKKKWELEKRLQGTKLRKLEDRIPEAYRSEEAINFFITALKNKRADTEKELFNLYEEERHRKRLEEIQEQRLQSLEESLTHCPKCGSTKCTMIVESDTQTSSFGFGKACCGMMLLGPLGILCGACGMGSYTTTETYWECRNCGKKFSG